MGNWQRVRMAADFEVEHVELAIESVPADVVLVDGMMVSATYGTAEDLRWLPDSYFRDFASATPAPRPASAIEAPAPPAFDRDNLVTASTLQREVKISIRGSGSKGRKRTKPLNASEEAIAKALIRDVGPIEQTHLGGRFTVYGLSRGEAEFYAIRPGEARAVLQQHVALVTIEGRRPDSVTIEHRGPRKPNFCVYGLDEAQVAILRVFPGSARAALVAHAHAVAGSRIRDRDGRVAV